MLAVFALEAVILISLASTCFAAVAEGNEPSSQLYDATLFFVLAIMMFNVVRRSGNTENAAGIAITILLLLCLFSVQVVEVVAVQSGAVPRTCPSNRFNGTMTLGGAVAASDGSDATSSLRTGRTDQGNVLQIDISTIFVIAQGGIVLALTLLAKRTHAQFGWRTFSRVAGYRTSLRAYRAQQIQRCTLEWSTLFTITSFVASLVLHAKYKRTDYTDTDRTWRVVVFVFDACWLAVAWFALGTSSPRRFLCCCRLAGARGYAVELSLLTAFLLAGIAQPVWLIAVGVQLRGGHENFTYENVISAVIPVVMRLGVIASAITVWLCEDELRSYFSRKARRSPSAVTAGSELPISLPEHIQTFVKTGYDERALAACQTGTKATILREGGGRSGGLVARTKHRECFMQLSDCLTMIRWSWTECLLIDELVDVRTSKDKPLHFVLIYSHISSLADRTITIVCRNLKHTQQWVHTLRLLRQAYARGWGLPNTELKRLKAAFKVASSGKESLSLNQQQTFFACLNCYFTKEELQAHHRQLTGNDDQSERRRKSEGRRPSEGKALGDAAARDVEEGGGGASTVAPSPSSVKPDVAGALQVVGKRGGWHWMLQLYLIATRDPSAVALVQRFANWRTGGHSLSLEDFRDFWRKEQMAPRSSAGGRDLGSIAVAAKVAAAASARGDEEAARLFELGATVDGEDHGYSVHNHEPILKLREFQRLLLSDENSAFDPAHQHVHQDMTRPLSDYLIFSSHNTYLTGNQYSSDSSADMYKRVLAMGCRCVELDCFDGPDSQPLVYHKFTMTTKVSLRSCLEAINEAAFPAPRSPGHEGGGCQSDYPVVLSLEMHCSVEQQIVLATMLVEIFGDRLLLPLPQQLVGDTPIADSPEALWGKIIVKGKRPKGHDTIVEDDFGDGEATWIDDGGGSSDSTDDDDDGSGSMRSSDHRRSKASCSSWNDTISDGTQSRLDSTPCAECATATAKMPIGNGSVLAESGIERGAQQCSVPHDVSMPEVGLAQAAPTKPLLISRASKITIEAVLEDEALSAALIQMLDSECTAVAAPNTGGAASADNIMAEEALAGSVDAAAPLQIDDLVMARVLVEVCEMLDAIRVLKEEEKEVELASPEGGAAGISPSDESGSLSNELASRVIQHPPLSQQIATALSLSRTSTQSLTETPSPPCGSSASEARESSTGPPERSASSSAGCTPVHGPSPTVEVDAAQDAPVHIDEQSMAQALQEASASTLVTLRQAMLPFLEQLCLAEFLASTHFSHALVASVVMPFAEEEDGGDGPGPLRDSSGARLTLDPIAEACAPSSTSSTLSTAADEGLGTQARDAMIPALPLRRLLRMGRQIADEHARLQADEPGDEVRARSRRELNIRRSMHNLLEAAGAADVLGESMEGMGLSAAATTSRGSSSPRCIDHASSCGSDVMLPRRTEGSSSSSPTRSMQGLTRGFLSRRTTRRTSAGADAIKRNDSSSSSRRTTQTPRRTDQSAIWLRPSVVSVWPYRPQCLHAIAA